MEQRTKGYVVNRRLGLGILVVVALLSVGTRTQEQGRAARVVTPQGVHVLQNKSFDDSDEARKEILDLYRDLRLTDVLDGMDLIGLQDIGLMDNHIRPLWRDVEKFTKIPYRTAKTGAPILNDCLAYIDCRVVSATESGDHTIFVGEIQEADFVMRGDALFYDRKDYLDAPPIQGQEGIKQKIFKITIKEIQGTGTCKFGFKAGDVFIHPDQSPPSTIPNFCAWAYHEIHPVLLTLKYGGRFPWEEINVAVACCSDSKNPVVFRIELIEK